MTNLQIIHKFKLKNQKNIIKNSKKILKLDTTYRQPTVGQKKCNFFPNCVEKTVLRFTTKLLFYTNRNGVRCFSLCAFLLWESTVIMQHHIVHNTVFDKKMSYLFRIYSRKENNHLLII